MSVVGDHDGGDVMMISLTVDVTRVLVLDSTQNAAMAETVAHLLKDIGEEQSRILFPVCA